MTLEKPLWMQPSSGDAAITYSAQQDRAGLLSAVFSREGVLDVDAGQLKVSQRGAGANFSIDVAAGRCAIVGDDVSDQGSYLCTSTTILNIATPTLPASGSRRHRVIARVKDKLHSGSWTTYEWTIEILQDTGSGTPAQPNSAITLGFVNMTSTMTSVVSANIEDARARASVGTPARTGTLSFIAAYGPDTLRPPSWHVNPDGWVSLAGWLFWNGTNQVVPAGTFSQNMLSTLLPVDIRPNTYRDMTMTTDAMPSHFRVEANGMMKFRPWWNMTLNNPSTWFSFDGCGYRL